MDNNRKIPKTFCIGVRGDIRSLATILSFYKASDRQILPGNKSDLVRNALEDLAHIILKAGKGIKFKSTETAYEYLTNNQFIGFHVSGRNLSTFQDTIREESLTDLSISVNSSIEKDTEKILEKLRSNP